jgi:cysteine desulfurase
MLSIPRIYLDFAASTPVDPEVERAMSPHFTEKFGNPGSLHSFGQEAMAALDKSRETITKSIGADFREIIFTGSATEANNLALRGAVGASTVKRPRIIVSAIEHESVLETTRDLARGGVEVVYVPVDNCGVVSLEKLKSALNERTVLVSIMYANNEIGTIQPIAEIAEIVKDFHRRLSVGGQVSDVGAVSPLLHTDAAQAFQFLDCNVRELGVDLMTLSAHKIYGPKGSGALYMKDGTKLTSATTGGGQEFGVRSGTENVPLIVGFAKAVELTAVARERESKRIGELRDYFWGELKKIYSKAELNGGQLSDVSCQTLPNILNVYFPGHLAEDLLTKFDLGGLAVSAGSACRSRAVESSYVIEALGYSKDRAKRNIRFSFGRPTTREEVKNALKIIRGILA